MKVLVIRDDNDINTVYKADTKEDLDYAAYMYLQGLYNVELEESLMDLLKNKKVEGAYSKLINSYWENADIISIDTHTIQGKK